MLWIVKQYGHSNGSPYSKCMPPTDCGGFGTRNAWSEFSSTEVAYDVRDTASSRPVRIFSEGGLATKVVAFVWAIAGALSSGWLGWLCKTATSC